MRRLALLLPVFLITALFAENNFLFALNPGVKLGVEFGNKIKVVPGLEISFISGHKDYNILGGLVFGMQPGLQYCELEIMSSHDRLIYGSALGYEKSGPGYFSRCRLFAGNLAFLSFTLPLGMRRCELDGVVKFPMISNATGLYWKLP
jgi:hypothetical protein